MHPGASRESFAQVMEIGRNNGNRDNCSEFDAIMCSKSASQSNQSRKASVVTCKLPTMAVFLYLVNCHQPLKRSNVIRLILYIHTQKVSFSDFKVVHVYPPSVNYMYILTIRFFSAE